MVQFSRSGLGRTSRLRKRRTPPTIPALVEPLEVRQLLSAVYGSGGGSGSGTAGYFRIEPLTPVPSLPDFGSVPRTYGLELDTADYFVGLTPAQGFTSPVTATGGETTTAIRQADGGTYTVTTTTGFTREQSGSQSGQDWTYLDRYTETFSVTTSFAGEDGTTGTLTQEGEWHYEFTYSYAVTTDGVVEVRGLSAYLAESYTYHRDRDHSETVGDITTTTDLDADRTGSQSEVITASLRACMEGVSGSV